MNFFVRSSRYPRIKVNDLQVENHCFTVMNCIRDCCDCSQFDRDLVEQRVECRIKEAVSNCGKFLQQKFNNMCLIKLSHKQQNET